jgi:hypothetical protein
MKIWKNITEENYSYINQIIYALKISEIEGKVVVSPLL